MKKVLIAMPHYSETCREGYKKLEKYGCELTEIPYDRNYTVDELKEIVGDVEGVIADSEKWCEETIAAAPLLKVIARFGTGMDSVDLDAAKRHGVIVTNCPGLNANTVAEQAVALLLSAARAVPYLDKCTKQGQWKRAMFHEISGSTVGILGFGNIGQKVARKMSGFDCEIVAYDLYPNYDAARKLGVQMTSLPDLLQRSDYISIHMPLLPETRHLIDRDFFAQMKMSAIMVNTARGALVDEADLYEALSTHRIAAYACDVFEQEPPQKDHPLFQCENFICTPHIAGETYENRRNTGLATANAVLDVFEGREPQNRRV